MLKPDKHTDPKLTVVFVAGNIVGNLNKYDVLSYDDLLGVLVSDISEKVKTIFQYALSFLYITGKIEYLIDIDGFRLIR